MKPDRPIPPLPLMSVAALVVPTFIRWIHDPAHPNAGRSRIPSPSAAPAKP